MVTQQQSFISDVYMKTEFKGQSAATVDAYLKKKTLEMTS